MLPDFSVIVNDDLKTIISTETVDWKLLKNKVVLITGANGFLPAYMVLTIIALNDIYNYGVKILALVRNEVKARDKFKSVLDRNDIKLIIQDVSNPIDVEGKIDFIIHAASQASPKFYGSDPVGTINANVFGTSQLLALAARKKVEKFLFFSSSEIYGLVSQEKLLISESDYGYIDPINVRSCYSEAKKLGETLCVSWMHQHQVPVNMIRIFHTYGPGMDLNDGRVFADFVSDIVNNRSIVMKSDGKTIRAFCYLSDAVLAYFLVLLHGAPGEAYNVGNSNCESSVINLAETLTMIYPSKKLKVIKQEQSTKGYINTQVQRVVPDISKILKLGWSPTVDIKNGFRRTIDSYGIDKSKALN